MDVVVITDDRRLRHDKGSGSGKPIFNGNNGGGYGGIHQISLKKIRGLFLFLDNYEKM